MNTAGSVLLDTNVVIAHLRNDPDLTARLRAAPAIYLPWVALGELHYGALRAQRREVQLALIRDFLQTAVVLLPDRNTSERYGEAKKRSLPASASSSPTTTFGSAPWPASSISRS